MLSSLLPARNIWSIFLILSTEPWHWEGCCVDASGTSYPKHGSNVWWTSNGFQMKSSLLKLSSVVWSGCYHKMSQTGWLKPQTLISHHFQAKQVQGQGDGTWSSWWELSSCLAGSCSLAVNSGGFSLLHACIERENFIELLPIGASIPWWRLYFHDPITF